MKTAQEWLDCTDFDWGDQASERMIEAIQKDAFDAGRAHQLRQFADDICNDLPKSAESMRKYANQLQPTPCLKKGEM